MMQLGGSQILELGSLLSCSHFFLYFTHALIYEFKNCFFVVANCIYPEAMAGPGDT